MVKEMLELMKHNPEVTEKMMCRESFTASLLKCVIPDYRKYDLETLMDGISGIQMTSHDYEGNRNSYFCYEFRFNIPGDSRRMTVVVQFDENLLTIGRNEPLPGGPTELFAYNWKSGRRDSAVMKATILEEPERLRMMERS